MIQKIKTLVISLALVLGVTAPAMVPAAASAAVQSNSINEKLCEGINDASGGGTQGDCFGTDVDGSSSLASIARKIINLFSIIVGIVAVIMIIYGGFRYITSGGSGEKVGAAKNTLIYAIIGLIIVALAQFLVHFVLTTTTQAV